MCQPCLDKLLEVMDSLWRGRGGFRGKGCMSGGFQTLVLYSLHPAGTLHHYIRDYYVQIDGLDGEKLEVIGIYAPVLENGERWQTLQRLWKTSIIDLS